jgi:hypothetical protein
MKFVFALIFTVSLFTYGLTEAHESAPLHKSHGFLQHHRLFSDSELKRIKAGEILTKQLKTDVKREMALLSIARMEVPGEFLIRNYLKPGMNIETAAADTFGRFSSPPRIEDVQNLRVPLDDLREMVNCKPPNCKVKAPSSVIRTFSQLDKSTPDFEAQANRLIRQGVVGYLNSYLKFGDKALIEYRDKKNPVRLAEELREIFKSSPYLYEHVPDLITYLGRFPKAERPDYKSTFFWMKENYGGVASRPTLTVNQLVTHKPAVSNGTVTVASKQLYATHYFEAAFGLTMIILENGGNEPAVQVLHINRCRIDVLRNTPTFLSQRLIKGAQDSLHKKMITVKKRVEKAYHKS